MNIYISNLGFDVQDEELKEFFTPFGEVSSAKVIMDKVTSRSRGFGFIEMPDEAASQKAIAELNGSTKGNRTIKVNEAKAKEGRPATEGKQAPTSKYDSGGFNNANSYNENRY